MTIKDKLDSIGIIDNESYVRYIQKWRETEIITDEQLALFDPDTIDNGEFWKYIDENFGHSVCGMGQLVGEVQPVEKQNNINLLYGLFSNTFSRFIGAIWEGFNIKVLEIGAGWGSLKSLCEKYPIEYNGIDTNPKIKGILKTDGYTIPTEGPYDFVISSNVFQHLSLKQRQSYYKEAHRVLRPNGYFSFNNFYDDKTIRYGCDSNGQRYIMHYGQFTPVQSPLQIIEQVTQNGFIVSDLTYCGGSISLNCMKV